MTLTISNEKSVRKRIGELDRMLARSFAKIRNDMSSLVATVEKLTEKVNKQNDQLESFAERINRLEKLTVSGEAMAKEAETATPDVKSRSVESTERSVSVRRTPNNNGLTNLHFELLKRLMILQVESGKRGITLRELATDMYPEKPYSQVKSTLSEYVKRLHEVDLVSKVRRGKLLVSYTHHALQFAESHRINRMKQLIAVPL